MKFQLDLQKLGNSLKTCEMIPAIIANAGSGAVQKRVNLVVLQDRKVKLELQNSASIQPRKSLLNLGLSNYFRRPTPDSLDQINSYVEWILKTHRTVWHMHEAAKKSPLFAKSILHSDPSKSFCRHACKMSTTDSLVSDDSLLSVRSPRTMLRNFHAVLRIVAIRKWDLGAVR